MFAGKTGGCRVKKKFYDIANRVAAYTDWIEETIAKNGGHS